MNIQPCLARPRCLLRQEGFGSGFTLTGTPGQPQVSGTCPCCPPGHRDTPGTHPGHTRDNPGTPRDPRDPRRRQEQDGRRARLVEADVPAEAPGGGPGAVREPRGPRGARRGRRGRERPRGQPRLRRPPREDRGQEHQGQARQGLALRPLQGEEESAGDAGRASQPVRGRRAPGAVTRPGCGPRAPGRTRDGICGIVRGMIPELRDRPRGAAGPALPVPPCAARTGPYRDERGHSPRSPSPSHSQSPPPVTFWGRAPLVSRSRGAAEPPMAECPPRGDATLPCPQGTSGSTDARGSHPEEPRFPRESLPGGAAFPRGSHPEEPRSVPRGSLPAAGSGGPTPLAPAAN